MVKKEEKETLGPLMLLLPVLFALSLQPPESPTLLMMGLPPSTIELDRTPSSTPSSYTPHLHLPLFITATPAVPFLHLPPFHSHNLLLHPFFAAITPRKQSSSLTDGKNISNGAPLSIEIPRRQDLEHHRGKRVINYQIFKKKKEKKT